MKFGKQLLIKLILHFYFKSQLNVVYVRRYLYFTSDLRYCSINSY